MISIKVFIFYTFGERAGLSSNGTNHSGKRNFETPYRPHIPSSVCPLLSSCSVLTFLKRSSILLLLHNLLSFFSVLCDQGVCVFMFPYFFLVLFVSVFFRCLHRCCFCVDFYLLFPSLLFIPHPIEQ